MSDQSDAEYSKETARQIAEAVRAAEEGRRQLEQEEKAEAAKNNKDK